MMILDINRLISFSDLIIKFCLSFYQLSHISDVNLHLEVTILKLTNINSIIMALCLFTIDSKNAVPEGLSVFVALNFEIFH